MGRPRKYEGYDIYAPQREYFKTDKGKLARKRVNATEEARASKRDWKRKRDGTIVDKQQWFIDTYGDTETALKLLDDRQRDVITKIFGLDGSSPMRQKDIAVLWELSSQSITDIKKKALNTLNRELLGEL